LVNLCLCMVIADCWLKRENFVSSFWEREKFLVMYRIVDVVRYCEFDQRV